MRLPASDLEPFVPSICEGILLWAEDSKNKFRLKVRVILERLARRCGFEALEKYIPESHRALLTHIRKQNNRKERKKSMRNGSEMEWVGGVGDDDDNDDDVRSRKSRARTVAKSAWNSDVFSDEGDDDDDDMFGGAKSTRALSHAMTTAKKNSRSVKSAPSSGNGNANARVGRGLPSSEDPLDLLDMHTARKMVRGGGSGAAGTNKQQNDEEIQFGMSKDGRMVIREEVPMITKKKRSRNEAEAAGFDSDDSDFEDLKGYTGLSLALRGAKSIAQAPSISASLGGGGNKSTRSISGKSMAKSEHSRGGGEQARRGGAHSGDRFKSKKKAGGDVKGNSKLEPYAYWPLDRKMLNRREQKTKKAKAGLDNVVRAVKEGAAKGRKAKRMRRA